MRAETACMPSSGRTTAQAAGLLVAGAVAGAVLAVTFTAGASSPAAGTPGPTSYAASGPGAHEGPGRFRPIENGTVTAVGTKSVTIKSSSGTKTYAVDANSDIDKNGEGKLSDLKAGDTVHFAVRPGTSTIGVLHAGDEALNRPAFGSRRAGGACPGGGHHDGDRRPAPGASPAPTSSS